MMNAKKFESEVKRIAKECDAGWSATRENEFMLNMSYDYACRVFSKILEDPRVVMWAEKGGFRIRLT